MEFESKIPGLLAHSNAKFEFRTSEHKHDLEPLKSDLAIIRSSLSKSKNGTLDYEITFPDSFLIKPLTTEQRKKLDQELAGFYANRSVEHQKIIASVPIKESFEKMLHIPSLFQESNVSLSLSDIPFNEACGEWAGKKRVFWLRESMATRLLDLGHALSEVGLMLHVEDAYRPIGVQEGLFKRRVNWISKEHPDWAWEDVITEAKSKTAVSPRLASHKSGAAIDITLRKIVNSLPLDLGNKYPEGGALVAIDSPFVTVEQWHTRQIFANSFKMAGFTIYPGEDWHASFCDNLAGVSQGSRIKDYVARYGPIKKFSLYTGEILDVYSNHEYDKFFTDN